MRAPIMILGLAVLLPGGAVAQAHVAPHWEYEGKAGPEHWGELDPAFATCGSGRAQSPVNVAGARAGRVPPIVFSYVATPAEILHNGHTVQVNLKPGSWITVGGRSYQLKQFHFHAPSENLIDGKAYPAEIHFVHADSAGSLAVVAVMVGEGAKNPALNAVWDALPAGPSAARPVAQALVPSALMPANPTYYRFPGSLTTPPCTEGVQWLVLREPVSASREQIARLVRALGEPNARPVQPLNGRVIEQ